MKPLLLLDVESRIPKGRVPGTTLSIDDKMAILCGAAHGYSINQIAKHLPASWATVRNYTQSLADNPDEVLRLPVLQRTRGKMYQCRLCSEVRDTWTKAARHVLSDVFPPEVAKGWPLHGVRKDVF